MSSRSASSMNGRRGAQSCRSGLNLKGFLAALGEGYGPEVSPLAIGKYFRFSTSNIMSNQQVGVYILQSLSTSRNELKKLKWHSNDKYVFVWVIYKFCELKRISNFSLDFDDWVEVGGILENDHEFLKRKWAAMVRHTTCLLRWSEEEEDLLSLYMAHKDYQYRWTDLSIKIHESLGRHILRGCKDVRQRWYNYLNPTLKKGKWTEEQDQTLKALVIHEGKRWSTIARLMEGRTENQVKNRVNSLLKRSIISQEVFREAAATSQTQDIRQQQEDNHTSNDHEGNEKEQNHEPEAATSPLIQTITNDIPIQQQIEGDEYSHNMFLQQYFNHSDDCSQLDFNLL